MCLSALLLLAAVVTVLAGDTPETPNDIYRRAAADLATMTPVKQRVTRYLTLHNYPLEAPGNPRGRKDRPGDVGLRWQLAQATNYTLNSVSLRSRIIRPPMTDDWKLMRVDLEEFGWDRASRIARRAELEKRGVKFAFKDKAEEERFLNPWEDLVRTDVYFKVSQVDSKGRLIRGWIDPVVEEQARRATNSGSFILRADRVLTQLLSEKDRGGSYSNFLMLPGNEKDFYRAFLVPIDAVERAGQLRNGGAVARSIVAFRNRGLEFFRSPYGHDVGFVTRTYDFLNDNVPEKNVFESLGGTLKHDGREVIFTLPNGLHGYQLYDGNGKQVEVVPQNIALDMRRDVLDKDRNVINPRSCVSCHHAVSGIQPYDDVVTGNALREGINLRTFSTDAARSAGRAYDLDDYYKIAEQGGMAREIVQYQESFARRVQAASDLTPEDNGRRVVGWYDFFVRDLVGLDQASRDMGLTVEAARVALRSSQTVVNGKPKPNSSLTVLSGGQEISRTQWEANYGDGMRAQTFDWETVIKH